MEFVEQSLDGILASLSPLRVDWQDEISRRIIDKINCIPVKSQYTEGDIVALLENGFTEGLIVCQLFLGISRDALSTELETALGPGGKGVQRLEAHGPGKSHQRPAARPRP